MKLLCIYYLRRICILSIQSKFALGSNQTIRKLHTCVTLICILTIVFIYFCFGITPKFALMAQTESSMKQWDDGTIEQKAQLLAFIEVGVKDVILPDHTVSSFRSQKYCTSDKLFCVEYFFNLGNAMSFLSDHFFFLTCHFPSRFRMLECSEPQNVAQFSRIHKLYYKHVINLYTNFPLRFILFCLYILLLP